MGIRKIFQKKDPTEEELREDLNKIGIATKSKNPRQEKFGAFKQYAQERQHMKPGLAPVNPYSSMGNSGDANPYSEENQEDGDEEPEGNPYSRSNRSLSPAKANPYAQSDTALMSTRQSSRTNASKASEASKASQYSKASLATKLNPYAQTTRSRSDFDGDTVTSSRTRASQYEGSIDSKYGDSQSIASSRLTRQGTRNTVATEDTLDLNEIPTNTMSAPRRVKRYDTRDDETLDLNDEAEEEDLNVELDDLQEEPELNSEDEEVEAIKQDIRFVKQESLALTRNTLRMAQEADASGTNTLGMLGSQSERLYNAEQNLLLSDIQTKQAEEKVKELRRLNRSIFIPAYGNPFNKKSRLAQQEENIKVQKTQEKYMRDANRKNMYESEQRLKQGITQNATSSEIHQKYQGENNLKAAQRYQFENDSEDDEIEKELASNLDQIGLYAKKLKNSANTMSTEVEGQNTRLRKIEEDTDKLDIDVHMNNTRLSNIH